MYKIILQIDGMACGMCEAHVNDAIRNRIAVSKIKSSYKKGTTEFLTETPPSENELHEILDPTGYRIISCTVSEAEKKKGLFGR